CESKNVKLAVLNLRGLSFFHNPIECPFRTADAIIPKLAAETPFIFIDFHAEATAEKVALGWYLDGKVSAIAGTHTHVPTADEQILPNGTGYISDVGFTGPHDSVIGMDKETAINRFLYQTPQKYKVAEENLIINGVIFQLDLKTAKTVWVERVSFPELRRSAK
ncbi:MAG: YmdB family metallophosphoesterase, partial [Bacteroidia bacterium]|nr:YmdB family metallophosphoesterase [Bacteroidia bacterium]